MKLACREGALTPPYPPPPPVVCSAGRSGAVVPVLVLFFIALWFKTFTAKLLRQACHYFKLRKVFLKFYRRHSALVEKI